MDTEQITRVDELEEVNQTSMTHFYCCSPTNTFCGAPIKGRPTTKPTDCVVCRDLRKMGYVCSCGTVWKA